MPSPTVTILPTSADTIWPSKSRSRCLMTSLISLALVATWFLPMSHTPSRRRRNRCSLVATLASMTRSPIRTTRPPRIAGSTRVSSMTSLASLSARLRARLSFSRSVSSTAAVAVARTLPAAWSTRAEYSSAMSPTRRTRPDSTRSFARLTTSRSARSPSTSVIASSRRSRAIVGFSSTPDTSGAENTTRTSARRSAQASSCPSCWASSKMARAYRLAAAPATGASHLLYRPVDEPTMPVAVESLPDHLLGGGDDEVRDLGAHAVEGPVALRDDLLARVVGDPLSLFFRTPARVGAELLRGLVRALDDARRLASRLTQLGLGVPQTPLGLLPGLLGRAELLGDRQLARLGGRHHAWVHPPGQDQHHDDEGDDLDQEREAQVEQAGRGQVHRQPLRYLAPDATEVMK